MDKNTLKMMLLMAVVIFAFMFINKPKPIDKPTGAQAVADETVAEVIDSIRPTESALIYAPDFIRQAGVARQTPDDGVEYRYRAEGVDLTLNGNDIAGTVKVDGGIEIPFEDVVNSNFADTLTFAQKKQAAATLRQALVDAGRYKSFAPLRNAPDTVAAGESIVLENNLISIEFSPKGGYMSRAVLKNYFTYFPSKENPSKVDTLPVVMFNHADASYAFALRTTESEILTSDLYFTPVVESDSTVLMNLDLGGGASWGIRYTLPEDSYVTRMEIVQKGMASVMPSNTDQIGMRWHMMMPRQERGRTFEERNSEVFYKYIDENPDYINGMKDGSITLEGATKWVAFKNQFFSNVIVADHPFAARGTMSQRKIQGDDYIKEMNADLIVDYTLTDGTAASFSFFIGPNLYPLLKQVDETIDADNNLKLNRLVPLGWSWLRWINTLIVIPVFNFLSSFIHSYGIIILLLTVFIKLLLFPLTYKSLRSQAKMRVLAPDIKEINEKYPGKENAMIRQQKTMALYSKAGASPFAGCLPMLLQMPILIAMFSFFPSAIELRGESFLWAQNLAAPDVILTLPFSIPFYGDHVSLFCLLMTITNIIYTRINMQNQPSSQGMPGMKWMMYLMPIMFLFFFNDYAAALSYYYFLSLLITIIQTYIFRRCVDEKKLRRQMMERAQKAPKKSGFMARLAEAQKRQQEELRRRQNGRR